MIYSYMNWKVYIAYNISGYIENKQSQVVTHTITTSGQSNLT